MAVVRECSEGCGREGVMRMGCFYASSGSLISGAAEAVVLRRGGGGNLSRAEMEVTAPWLLGLG